MTMIERSKLTYLLRAARFAAVFVAPIIAVGAAPTGASAGETVLYSFSGGSDGANPYAGLSLDPITGKLCGATFLGGSTGQGVVFELSTSGGTPSILYTLPGSGNGAGPIGTPVFDASGNLLGTAAYNSLSGGLGSGSGIVFEIPAGGSPMTVHPFSGGSDGANPFAGLSPPDTNGNFYGATFAGGSSSDGTLFEITLSGTTYSYSRLYSFTGGSTDGASPYAAPSLDASNNVYGTTTLAGSSLNEGAVYKRASTGGAPALLHGFNGSSHEGTTPRASVLVDSSGNIFGTTSIGGTSGKGVVFKLTPTGTGAYTYSTLYNFTGSTTDGGNPWSGVIADSSGDLWGTTTSGGASGLGVIFELVPTGGGAYSYNNKYSFSGGTSDGANPYASLILVSGAFYGTTVNGGASGKGSVFKYTP